LSEPKLISPMLDDFAMGGPISNHHGVRCCPAMPNDSDKKYIVKIISIPASQVQVEALLLTGACNNEASALSYFKELSDEVAEEVEVLNRLSKLEGFLPYESCQIEPMESEIGYDVYLLSPYKRSLEKYFRRNTMTHLSAVNLGLDICASLAVCRQAGYIYVDLKPSNIFVSDDNEFRIGDIGFVKLNALQFASIPDKYRSAYTAPEIADALSTLNTTVDVYAAGMVLYQAYNGGVLPFEGNAPENALEAPIYADYEMAEIILKAIDPDPAARWQDPIAMGQALVAYMQRNSVNDTPIVPPSTEPQDSIEIPEEPVSELSDESDDDIEQIQLEEFNLGNLLENEAVGTEENTDESIEKENEDDFMNLSFLDEMESDDTTPTETTAGVASYGELSDDASDILSQADDLIAHEAPDPVVAPPPVEIPMPPPIAKRSRENEETKVIKTGALVAQESKKAEESQDDFDYDYDEDFEDDYEPMDKKSVRKLVAILLVLLLLAGLAYGGYIFYKDYYIQYVTDMTLTGSEDKLEVSIVTDVDPALLTVVCTDTHGQRLEAPLTDGIATFTGLNPNTVYTVKVEVSGLRKLEGDVSNNYTTPAQTDIVNFSAITGSENGSVILNFTVSGVDTEAWLVTYSADGEEEKTVKFSGHMVTINGLTEGKVYTFTLGSDAPLYITGTNQVNYTATAPVFAENLAITGCADNNLDVSWNAPEGSVVKNWYVRCYNDNGYDVTVTTGETAVTFNDIDSSHSYTVEVTAEGMSSGDRCYMTANAVTVSNIKIEPVDAQQLTITWDHSVSNNNGQWFVMYTVDASDSQQIIRTNTNSAIITNYVPDSTYEVSIQLESGATVFGGNIAYKTNKAATFEGYLVSADKMTWKMCNRPEKSGWTWNQVKDSAYTNTFKVGTPAAFVVRLSRQYNTSPNMITTMYVIRDENGKLISSETTAQTWTSMWYKYYCELDIPSLPDKAGTYTMEVYLNGAWAHEQTFYVTE